MQTNTLFISCVLALAAGCASDRQKIDTSPQGPALTEPLAQAAEEDRGTTPAQAQDPSQLKTEFTPLAKPSFSQRANHPVIGMTHGDMAAWPAREATDREHYEHPGDHGVMRVTDVPVSTFSIDVDTGAYSTMRRWLNQGQLPPENAVRVEEYINYFNYEYEPQGTREQPFSVNTEIAPTPWNSSTHLLRIGIQGYQVPTTQLPDANLVFLVDVSGSMHSSEKLPLLRNALKLLTDQMDASDCISLVVYAGSSGVVLKPTAGDQKATIKAALDQLEAGGSTNGAAGIRLAYEMARQAFKPEGVNRVILATDGDFNVGLASTDELVDLVQRQRESGIALTTLGFGSGNYNDHLMEQLADEGNGQYAYIDRLSEAQKVLGQQRSGTLMTIAKDVKIQLEFNHHLVSEYRLIGYENRALDEEDFDNDRVDAGEIGAGHDVTALYEISLKGQDEQRLKPRRYSGEAPPAGHREARELHADELAFLKIRYKQPKSSRSQVLEYPVLAGTIKDDASAASSEWRFAAAVAAYGQQLRGGTFLEDFGYEQIAALAMTARGTDAFGYRGEFLQLVRLAESLSAQKHIAQE